MPRFVTWNGPEFIARIRQHPTAHIEPVLQDILRLLLFTAFEGVVIGNQFGNPTGTPVQTGWARASWYVELGTMTIAAQYAAEDERRSGGDPAGGVAMARTALLGDVPLGTWVYFVNGAIYAVMLEYGTSEQAPAGMVRLITRSGQLILNHAVRMIAR